MCFTVRFTLDVIQYSDWHDKANPLLPLHTRLIQRNAALKECYKSWNRDNPDEVHTLKKIAAAAVLDKTSGKFREAFKVANATQLFRPIWQLARYGTTQQSMNPMLEFCISQGILEGDASDGSSPAQASHRKESVSAGQTMDVALAMLVEAAYPATPFEPRIDPPGTGNRWHPTFEKDGVRILGRFDEGRG